MVSLAKSRKWWYSLDLLSIRDLNIWLETRFIQEVEDQHKFWQDNLLKVDQEMEGSGSEKWKEIVWSLMVSFINLLTVFRICSVLEGTIIGCVWLLQSAYLSELWSDLWSEPLRICLPLQQLQWSFLHLLDKDSLCLQTSHLGVDGYAVSSQTENICHWLSKYNVFSMNNFNQLIQN